MTLPIPSAPTPSPSAGPGRSGAAGSKAVDKPPLLSRARILPAAITIGVFAAILVVLQIINAFTSYALTSGAGIVPRTLDGLWGVLDAPLLHAGWSHLVTNLIPVLVLGFLLLITGVRQFVAVTVLVWLISGLGVWLTAPSHSVTVGASVLVFGWLSFLVLRGFFARHLGQIVMGLILLAVWGGIFWGLLPGKEGISWQGHLFGAIAGALAALLVARADAPRKAATSGR